MTDHLGIIAVTFMVGAYALEARGRVFILIFALACALASFYAYLIGSWPFVIAEGLWALIALRRWWNARESASPRDGD